MFEERRTINARDAKFTKSLGFVFIYSSDFNTGLFTSRVYILNATLSSVILEKFGRFELRVEKYGLLQLQFDSSEIDTIYFYGTKVTVWKYGEKKKSFK